MFAATKGFRRALLEDKVREEWSELDDLTKEGTELLRQNDEAKHFLIMSSRGDAFRDHRIARNCLRNEPSAEGEIHLEEDKGLVEAK